MNLKHFPERVGKPLHQIAAPSGPELILATLIAVLIFYFYAFFHAFPFTSGKTLAGWTWYACNSKSGFLHGRFIPFVFVIMAYVGVRRAKDELVRPDKLGLLFVGLALAFYLLAIRTKHPRLALVGIPFLLFGLVLQLFGRDVAKHFVFPSLFWFFVLPVPGLETLLSGKLQIIITQLCYHTGSSLGMDLALQNNRISGPGWGGYEIAPGCSGIRSLMAMIMIGAVYAYYTQRTVAKKVVLFIASIPLAILGNFGRIFTILLLAVFGFPEFAGETYHDWAGLLLFFPISLAGLFLGDHLINYKTRKRRKVRTTIRKQAAAVGGTEGE